MAKIMISLPDELLERLDAHALQSGKTRSGLLQELAERAIRTDGATRRREILDVLARGTGHGGDAAHHVAAERRRR